MAGLERPAARYWIQGRIKDARNGRRRTAADGREADGQCQLPEIVDPDDSLRGPAADAMNCQSAIESPATGLETATACNSDDGNTDHQHDRRITRMEAKREVAVGLSAGRGAVAQRLEGKP
jgi:hypothetical protein